MEQQKPICFIIMGFGKKKDPDTNRTIDLDATYNKIIQPAVNSSNCICIRADEIIESGIIDKSMYALLYRAEIVIADISTYNPNAIYELGVRHTLKPYSTIIIREDAGMIPFDISHCRILNYKHLGNEISDTEAKRCTQALKTLITNILANPQTDSPLYTYIPQINQPTLSDQDIKNIIGELRNKENTIYALTTKAKKYMSENNFSEAAKVWAKLSEKAKNEKYYIQQQALCLYKSEQPSELCALTSALTIINKIENQSDTETLGVKGAIYKRLWNITKDANYLDYAIDNYAKGWNIYKDYYTGENYANCLYMKSKKETGEEQTYYKIFAQKIQADIIYTIHQSLAKNEPEELKWKYATLAICYFAAKDQKNASKYETLFRQQSPEQWEISSFEKTKSIYQNN
ncbi:MAG: hypothetical protein NC250_09400 [Alistipes senegalensis]|nr:hypothetical protein [Bacteroides cellulosilyticus]MCM1352930.1 hypothetical protein [Alistipes senegalensis]